MMVSYWKGCVLSFYIDLEVKLESLRTAGTAVMAVCAVMGTTEESAIDDLDEILKIRDRMRKKVQCTLLANIPDDISRHAPCNNFIDGSHAQGVVV